VEAITVNSASDMWTDRQTGRQKHISYCKDHCTSLQCCVTTERTLAITPPRDEFHLHETERSTDSGSHGQASMSLAGVRTAAAVAVAV
jgi:hypothetical protein